MGYTSRKEYPNDETVMYAEIVDRTEKSANASALRAIAMDAFINATKFYSVRTAKLAEVTGVALNDDSHGYLNKFKGIK